MGNERMERKITIEEHVLYKEDYQMKMLKANSPEGFLKVAGRGMNGSSYYDYDVSGKISMQAMYTRAKLKAEDIRQFMYQFGNVLKETGKYLLDIHCILLEPEYKLQSGETNRRMWGKRRKRYGKTSKKNNDR